MRIPAGGANEANDFLFGGPHIFSGEPIGYPGSLEYDAAFCQHLARSASADAASIWRVDRSDRLHLVYSTDIPQDRVKDITLRLGEGISGAAALSRQPVLVG